MDTLQRFMFKDTDVRGEIVRLDNTLSMMMQHHDFPYEICDLLSQTSCAAVLLSAILKYDGQLTLQFQSDGPLKMLVAICDNHHRVRGTAQWDNESLFNTIQDDFQNGQLVVTIKKNKPLQRYQSIVKINHQSISKSLEEYFLQSEQLETRLWLAYDHNTQHGAGLLLQKLPHAATTDESHWQHIQALANTLSNQELLSWNNELLLNNIFHEETIQLFDPQPITFYCPCDANKMLQAISVLGEQEALAILSTNRLIDVTCEYCNKHFEFDTDEVKRLFTKH